MNQILWNPERTSCCETVSFRTVMGISSPEFLTWQSLTVTLKDHYLSSFHVINLLFIPTQISLSQKGQTLWWCYFYIFLLNTKKGFLEGEVFFLEENLSYLKYSLGTLLEFDNYPLFSKRMIVTSLLVV